jgi:hypothetical protein
VFANALENLLGSQELAAFDFCDSSEQFVFVVVTQDEGLIGFARKYRNHGAFSEGDAFDNDLAAYDGAGGDLHAMDITISSPPNTPVKPNAVSKSR